MSMYRFSLSAARNHQVSKDFVGRVKRAFTDFDGGSFREFLESLAYREALTQLDELLDFSDALDACAERVPGWGVAYPVEVVRFIFAADDYNYLPQFMAAGLVSEPQGGLVSIDWTAIKCITTCERRPLSIAERLVL